GSSVADGVTATETATNLPGETSGSGGNSETTADGAVPTEETPRTAPGTVFPGEPFGDVAVAAPPAGEQPAHRQDATQNPGSKATGSSGSPDQTISVPDSTATGTEQGQNTSASSTQAASGEPVGSRDVASSTDTVSRSDSTETAAVGTGNTSKHISETTAASKQSSDIVPGQIDINKQTTQTEDFAETTGTTMPP
ncbi:hypothetical protein ACHAP5_011158, partial [Fusarium lateritium]